MDGGVAAGATDGVRTNGGCSGWVVKDTADKDLLWLRRCCC